MLPHTIITASAGAGKTWSLTVRFIRLLTLGAAPESIIALTFSRKAAGEFFNAILHRLATAAATPEAAARLATDVENPALTQSDFRRCLVDLVSRMHVLTLGTLDSFFIRIARSFPFELGLDGDFAILDAHRQWVEKERVCERVFTPDPGEAATRAREAFLFAFQEATWGREDVSLRLNLDRFLDHWHHLFLRAPDKAQWGDAATIWPDGLTLRRSAQSRTSLEQAIRRELAKLPLTEKQIERFDAFFLALSAHTAGTPVAKELNFILDRTLPILDDLADGEAVLTIQKKLPVSGLLASHLHTLVSDIAAAEMEIALRQTQGIYDVVASYDHHYHRLVRRQGRLTFHDVQLILSGDLSPDASGPAALLARRGTHEESRQLIDYRLDARYHHWLLDEFQDTSRVQWRILSNLCDEVIQDGEGEKSFFAVGDQKQSIYGWRGGDPRLFDDILAHYNQETDVIRQVPLARSQRSGTAVISMVNELLGQPDKLREKLRDATVDAWPWQEHESAHPEYDGCTAVVEVTVEKGEEKDDVIWGHAASILTAIQPARRGLTCAILCHRNRRARDLADFLRAATGMDVACESDVSIAGDNPATSALLALCQAAVHPDDHYSWQQVIMSPLRRVMEANADWVSDAATPDERLRAMRPRVSLDVLRQIRTHGFDHTLLHWIRGLRRQMPGMDSFSLGRMEELCACAREFDSTGSRDVDEFLAFARNWKVRESAQGTAIQVMTVHKSKGLTFDLVILADLHDTHMYYNRSETGIKSTEDGTIEWLTQLPVRKVAEADPVLRGAMEDALAAKWLERLAQLYVGVTRARFANYLLLPPPPSWPGDEPTLAALIRHLIAPEKSAAALTDLPVGETALPLLRLWGNPAWYEGHVPELPPAEAKGRGVQMDLFAASLPMEPPGKTRAPVRIPLRPHKPSLDPDRIDGAGLFEEARHARDAGTLVHQALSLAERADAAGLAAFETALAATFPAPDEATAAALTEARACLSAPALAAVFTPAADTVIWRERAFEAVVDGIWVSGVFDRVLLTCQPGGRPLSAVLVDFKAGSGSTGLTASHRRQLRLYARALCRLTDLPDSAISTAVVFTGTATLTIAAPD